MKTTRKALSVALVLVLTFSLFSTVSLSAFAEEFVGLGEIEQGVSSDENSRSGIVPENQIKEVLFTEELAMETAEEFAAFTGGRNDLTAGAPVKFYSYEGQALGYIIDYYNALGEPNGYVVFDSTDESLISMYSFAPEAVGPATGAQRVIATDNALRSELSSATKVYQCGVFSFCVANAVSERAVTATGAILDISESIPQSTRAGIYEWDDIFINWGPVQYNLLYMSSLSSPFVGFPRDWITGETGRYACCVTAMLPAVYIYTAAPQFVTFAAIYYDLWDLSDTWYTGEYLPGGIALGQTYYSDIGNAVTSFCNARPETTTWMTWSYDQSPSYAFFAEAIARDDTAIFCCNINTDEGDEGHAMAVQGTATLQEINTGNYLNVLLVYDGWNPYGAYINYDYVAGSIATTTAGVDFYS